MMQMGDSIKSLTKDLEKMATKPSVTSFVGGKLFNVAKNMVVEKYAAKYADSHIAQYMGPSETAKAMKEITRGDFFDQLVGIRKIYNDINNAFASIPEYAALSADVPIYGPPRWLMPMTWDHRAELAPHLAKLRQAGITTIWMPPLQEMLNWGPTIQDKVAHGIPPEEAVAQVLPPDFLHTVAALERKDFSAVRLPFPDLLGHWSHDDVEAVFAQGIVNGMPDGSFSPDQPLTRAAMTKLIVLAAGITPQPEAPSPVAALSDHWLVQQGYLQAAVKHGIVKLEDYATFEPEGSIPRWEIAVFTMRALSQWPLAAGEARAIFSDLTMGHAQTLGYIAGAYKAGIVKGYDTPQGKEFRPDAGATRAEAVVMVRRFQDQLWKH